MGMKCRQTQKSLDATLFEFHEEELHTDIMEHIVNCPGCACEYEMARKVLVSIKPTQTVQASADLKQRILRELRKEEDIESGTVQKGIKRYISIKPIFAAAALILLMALSILYWQRTEKSAKSIPASSAFLSSVWAAERSLFSGDGITHIVNEIVVTPVSNPVLASIRWMPLVSLEADGKPGFHQINLPAEPDEQYTVGDTIWFDPKSIKNIKEVIFLDIYVANSSLKCIDQHIISKDLIHNKEQSLDNNKLNPNLQRIRYASSDSSDNRAYAWKYPFGTVHYVIACLEALGYTISIKNNVSFLKNVNTFDIVLRADDAARSTSKNYRENALDWWRWLVELGGTQTNNIAKYCSNISYEHAQNCYNELSIKFRREFGCHTNDGNFSKQLKQNNGEINIKINKYIKSI